eukprot:scaffold204903_cov21-Prasinocladus_malaysianus.AAC.1
MRTVATASSCTDKRDPFIRERARRQFPGNDCPREQARPKRRPRTKSSRNYAAISPPLVFELFFTSQANKTSSAPTRSSAGSRPSWVNGNIRRALARGCYCRTQAPYLNRDLRLFVIEADTVIAKFSPLQRWRATFGSTHPMRADNKAVAKALGASNARW